jgi:hypothetical protein
MIVRFAWADGQLEFDSCFSGTVAGQTLTSSQGSTVQIVDNAVGDLAPRRAGVGPSDLTVTTQSTRGAVDIGSTRG